VTKQRRIPKRDRIDAPVPPTLALVRGRATKAYSLLRRHLGRFRPIHYAPHAAAVLRTKEFTDAPIHRVLHTIEANCAYANSMPARLPTPADVILAMQLYAPYEDAVQSYTVSRRGLLHFAMHMTRHQVELHYQHSIEDVARTWNLFVRADRINRLKKEMQSEYAISILQWMQLCLLGACGATTADGRFSRRALEWGSLVPPSAIDSFMRLSAQNPKDIAANFLSESSRPESYWLIRSQFLGTPLMDCGQNRILAPSVELIWRHSWHGIYRLIRSCPSFSDEFGPMIEWYVRRVLSCTTGATAIIAGGEIEKLVAPRRSCDFVVDFPSATLLVECKGVTFTNRWLDEDGILNDNSTGKVGDAMVQLYSTANDIAEGRLAWAGVAPGKPMVGVVATFGDIPFVNSDRYFDTFIFRRAEQALQRPIYPSAAMSRRPIVLSLASLELLIMLLNALGETPVTLYDQKAAESY